MYALCGVVVMPAVSTEFLASSSAQNGDHADVLGRKINIGIVSDKSSYQVQVYSGEGADVSFAAIQGVLKTLIESLPNRELRSIVYTIE